MRLKTITRDIKSEETGEINTFGVPPMTSEIIVLCNHIFTMQLYTVIRPIHVHILSFGLVEA